jgi:hypothetical protein
MVSRQDILELADALRLAARAETEAEWSALLARFAPGSDTAGYLQRLGRPGEAVAQPLSLRGLRFAPQFLFEGLRLLSGRDERMRRYLLEVLAAGLATFADYFERIANRLEAAEPTPAQVAALEPLKKRYFAYCLAQLTEAGMDLHDVFSAMKLDTLDMNSSLDVHGWQKKGRTAILAAPLFTPAEHALWRAIFDQEDGAWARMREHLVAVYQLPFLPRPPALLH